MVVDLLAVQHAVPVVVADLDEEIYLVLEGSGVCDGHALDVLLPIYVALVFHLHQEVNLFDQVISEDIQLHNAFGPDLAVDPRALLLPLHLQLLAGNIAESFEHREELK